ncbi:MAG: LysR family transcriptional regulator [Alphaproteobacteria bacterium]|nr:LysR family transcriptional regulator [Alphaproteobacteria bacterium]
MVTMRHLRYLVALAETRHFGRAAELCHVTQPAMSAQIRELEEMLGIDLVERRRGAIAITSEGEEIVRRAAAVVASVRDIEDLARQRQGVLVGPLALGIIPTVAPYLLPLCLATLRARHPRLEPRLRETRTTSLLAELAAGRIDVAILALPVDRPELETLALFTDRFLLATAADDPDAAAGPADAATIRPERLLLLEDGHCLREQALAHCRLASAANLATLGATSLTTVLQMVAAGYGVTLMPELVARAGFDDPRIVLRPFREPAPAREIALAWRAASPRRKDFQALGRLVTECWKAADGRAAA